MVTKRAGLSFDVEVTTEQRNGYFASRTKPFAVTVYAQTENEAEERAMQAIILLLRQHMKTRGELSDYLNQKNVKHVLHSEAALQRPSPVIRTSRREMRLEVPASAC